MAERELSILARQCLNQCVLDLEYLRREVSTWRGERDRARTSMI